MHHAVVDGQILVWDEGFTVWQGPELEPIDVGFLRPRPIQGVEWTNEGDQALAIGGTVILPLTVYGRVRFDELFDVPPALAGRLVVENEDDPTKTSNTVGETYVVRARSEIVGRFRVELRDSTLAVMVDADRGNTLMQLDARDLGVDPESVWRGMYIGRIHGPNTGAMLTAGVRQPFSPPTPFTYIREQLPTYAVLDSRLVELTVFEIPNQSERHTLVSVWTSPDGFGRSRQPDARLDGRLVTDLRLCSRRNARANQALVGADATSGSAVPAIRGTYDPPGHRAGEPTALLRARERLWAPFRRCCALRPADDTGAPC